MNSCLVDDNSIIAALKELEEGDVGGGGRADRRFHPFPARMPLSVAKHLISSLTSSDATVLDPMMGSGTTLIAARSQGRKSRGFDRDPLSVSVAHCATTVFRTADMDALRRRLLDKARDYLEEIRASREQHLTTMPEEDRKFLDYWFPNSSQDQLFALVKAISSEKNPDEVELAWIVFSSLIIAKSAGASYALDIPRSRPHKKEDKLIVPPFEGWNRRFRTAMQALPFVDSSVGLPTCATSLGDARDLQLDDASIDFVLTSPPYLTAVDYLRGHKFSLVWRGHRLATLREIRGTMIGTERGLWEQDGLPIPIENRLNDQIEQARRCAQVRRYLSDIRETLRELQRVLVPDGLAVLVVGPSIIDRTRSDSDEILFEIARSVDLKPVASGVRVLDSSRRSLPPPGSADDSALSKRMRTESILAFRK